MEGGWPRSSLLEGLRRLDRLPRVVIRPPAAQRGVSSLDRAPTLEGLLIETLHPKLNVLKKRK